MSEARSWNDTSPCVAVSGQDTVAVFAPQGKSRLPVIGGITAGWLISYQGNQQRDTPLTTPLISYPNWGLGQVCRKVSHLSRV